MPFHRQPLPREISKNLEDHRRDIEFVSTINDTIGQLVFFADRVKKSLEKSETGHSGRNWKCPKELAKVSKIRFDLSLSIPIPVSVTQNSRVTLWSYSARRRVVSATCPFRIRETLEDGIANQVSDNLSK